VGIPAYYAFRYNSSIASFLTIYTNVALRDCERTTPGKRWCKDFLQCISL